MHPPADGAELTLSAFERSTRDMLVPLLLYKSVFLGEWYRALVAMGHDPRTREQLESISQDTLKESLELLRAMKAWMPSVDPGGADELVTTLQRNILWDLMTLKEGTTEAVTICAMRAHDASLRNKLLRLADRDRVHADSLRLLLGADVEVIARRRRGVIGAEDVGAHAGRDVGSTLAKSIERTLARLRDVESRPARLAVSAAALRHLRDEGAVAEDGTAFGLPVDIDFGWQGECYSIVTLERVRHAQLLALDAAGGPD